MTLFKKRKNLAVSILLLFVMGCNKENQAPKSPEEYYISKQGTTINPKFGSAYQIIIPPDALAENQYVMEKIIGNTAKLVLDSTFSFGTVSENICFATYNCASLLIPGTIKLSVNSKYAAFSSQTKAYCISNETDMTDFTNWQEVYTTMSFNGQISFQFTDLHKTYFLGWISN